jgi:hypothetical protein
VLTTNHEPMKKHEPRFGRLRPLAAAGGLAVAAAWGLASCGGGGNPLGNPDTIQNPPTQGGQKLSFIYFQKCINPIFLAVDVGLQLRRLGLP